MIRTKLALWNAVVLALVLMVLETGVYVATRSQLYGAVDQALEERVKLFHTMWRDIKRENRPPPNSPPPGMREFNTTGLGPEEIRRSRLERELTGPHIFDINGKPDPNGHPSDGQMWSERSFRLARAGEKNFATVWYQGSRIRVVTTPLKEHGRVTTIAQFGANLDQADDAVALLGRILLTLLPLALVTTTLTGIYLTKRALAPVGNIAKTAEMIEATNLGGRLQVIGKDEFASLATTFNSMLERLQRSFERLAEVNVAQRRFIGDASHELKTPLTAIKTRVGIALRGKPTPERYQEHLAAIGRSADTMNAIVADLLLLARSDEGHLELRPMTILAQEIVDNAVSNVHTLTPIKIEIHVNPDLSVEADPPLACRVLTNLLTNALRHTEPTGTIEVTADFKDGYGVFKVRDTGCGIPPEHLGHVFERFHRVQESRDRESGGTGLGLPIAKSIVESHGGSIQIESCMGMGTTATFSLPASAP